LSTGFVLASALFLLGATLAIELCLALLFGLLTAQLLLGLALTL